MTKCGTCGKELGFFNTYLAGVNASANPDLKGKMLCKECMDKVMVTAYSPKVSQTQPTAFSQGVTTQPATNRYRHKLSYNRKSTMRYFDRKMKFQLSKQRGKNFLKTEQYR